MDDRYTDQTQGGNVPPSQGYGQYQPPQYGDPRQGYGQYQPPQYGGPQYTGPQYPVNQRSKLVAGLLGVFLGGWGVHRFYLGYTGTGIAQVLVTLCTFGVGALWGFIEGILILCGSESFRTDANGVPLRNDC